MHIDTQIISYGYKGKEDVAGSNISAIALSEFLEMFDNSEGRYRYFIPSAHRLYMDIRENHPLMGERTADRVIISSDIPQISLVYRSNVTLANLVNSNNPVGIKPFISHLEKRERRKIEDRYRFVISKGIKVAPFGAEAAKLARPMLKMYFQSHNSKGNIRNSINDVIIFATALGARMPLITRDNELNRFMASHSESSIDTREGGGIIVRPPTIATPKQKMRETKHYINIGWRISLNR